MCASGSRAAVISYSDEVISTIRCTNSQSYNLWRHWNNSLSVAAMLVKVSLSRSLSSRHFIVKRPGIRIHVIQNVGSVKRDLLLGACGLLKQEGN